MSTSLFVMTSHKAWVFGMLTEFARRLNERAEEDFLKAGQAIREESKRDQESRSAARAEYEQIMSAVGTHGPTPDQEDRLQNLEWTFEPPTGAGRKELIEIEMAALRVGIFLAGYGHLERCLKDICREAAVTVPTKNGLVIERILRGLESLDLAADLVLRLTELNRLRNELAHAGGYCTDDSRDQLESLINGGEVRIEEEDGRIVLTQPFTERALHEMRETYLLAGTWWEARERSR